MKNSSFNENSEVIFFDGVCNLCNWFVDFVITRSDVFMFASLQGEAAKKALPNDLTENLPSVVLWDHGQIYRESAAALRILSSLGGLYKLWAVFFIVPAPLRDLVYKFIARNRYRWFGQRDTCRLPTPAERARFLD